MSPYITSSLSFSPAKSPCSRYPLTVDHTTFIEAGLLWKWENMFVPPSLSPHYSSVQPRDISALVGMSREGQCLLLFPKWDLGSRIHGQCDIKVFLFQATLLLLYTHREIFQCISHGLILDNFHQYI